MSSGAIAVIPQMKPLVCPNCGGTVNLLGSRQAVNAVCPNCTTILDATNPTLRVIQTFHANERFQPLIPFGARGKLHNIVWEMIGFQVREITVEGVAYRWAEYLLYNPYHGYRYLSEYQGHWNHGRTIPALPNLTHKGRKEAAWLGNVLFTHFQTADATTIYVMGEFPWQVRVGEKVTVKDYVAPPAMLSAEITPGEVVWSQAEYTRGTDIWKAFQLPGMPPTTVGVFSNQLSPYKGKIGGVWKTLFLLLGIMVAIMIAMAIMNRNETVFSQDYTFTAAPKGEASFVTSEFDLKGRPSNVDIDVKTDLDNDWAFFGLALINEDTGTAYDVGKEVSYYHDSEGSEGSKTASVTIPAVPPGRYYLRVEPEMDENATSARLSQHAMRYSLAVKHDVPNEVPFIFVFFLLLIPPIFTTIRSIKFENARWAESDYGPIFKSSGSSDD